MEGHSEVLAQDAVARGTTHALAGEVPALRRCHGGKRPQGALPGADDRELRKLPKWACCRGARALLGRAGEVAPRALVSRGEALKANLFVNRTGSVVAIHQRETPLLAGRWP